MPRRAVESRPARWVRSPFASSTPASRPRHRNHAAKAGSPLLARRRAVTRTHCATVAREDRLDGVAEGRRFGGVRFRGQKHAQKQPAKLYKNSSGVHIPTTALCNIDPLNYLDECLPQVILNDLESVCCRQCVNAGVVDTQDGILKRRVIFQGHNLKPYFLTFRQR